MSKIAYCHERHALKKKTKAKHAEMKQNKRKATADMSAEQKTSMEQINK